MSRGKKKQPLAVLPNDRVAIRSIRGYRRLMDEVTAAARDGVLPWGDAKKAIDCYHKQIDTMMAEHVLKAQGVTDMEMEGHPLGDDGGVLIRVPEEFVSLVQKEVKIARGFDKMGQPVHSINVTLKGGPGMREADVAAMAEKMAAEHGVEIVDMPDQDELLPEPVEKPLEIGYDVPQDILDLI